MKNKIFLAFTFIMFSTYSFAASITDNVNDPTCRLANFPKTTDFLRQMESNINWMVAVGLLLALGMTIIHLFTPSHHENILKALLKTFAGLIILKAVSFLITKIFVGVC
jgi:magnesium-transporting ATPase (P-type)